MTPPRIAAVVLAAGLSSRMGGNKLLLPVAGEPIVRRVAEAALASRATHVIVVTGHNAPAVSAALLGLDIQIVENREFARGLSESLKCGLRNLPADCDGTLILLGDMPYVSAPLLNKLIEAFDPAGQHTICVPVRRGRRGNPVLWGRSFFPELLALHGDKGAKPILEAHNNAVCEVEATDDGVLIDIDTPEDLKKPHE